MLNYYETELDGYGEVEVEYEAVGSYRGFRNSYGVPEEPDEDGYIEIHSVKYNENEIIDLLDKETIKKIETEIEDNANEPDYDYDD